MTENLRAENERLTNLNDGLSRQLIAMGQRLEDSRRELMATGWDAFADRLSQDSNGVPAAYVASLKADNPYRKPVIDLSGAIICKTGDQS
ncbi:hypothetical protein [Paenarthrobacter nitroguajacolicus]|uniref:hypothetical protein n=1 Tax=Paenarthrobacter nitroguajacolicus TaxID=211146 RepID=UPI0015C02D18|nr:hypothetical protein [Paenarthrobacter nitroguajacolicus]NWL34452.1 hypothetical protein [Paenarthrobacter nitroguajacolicus]